MDCLEVLICQGCDIASALDVGALERLASKHQGVKAVRSLPCLCDEQAKAIFLECARTNPQSLVIAACSGRFVPLPLPADLCPVERVALRELAVWSQPDRGDGIQALAEDYLRIGLIRATKSGKVEAQTVAAERRILVVGGGPSGIAATLTAARAGLPVVLVEKEAELGGWLRSTTRLLPSRAPFRELEANELSALIAEIERHPLVDVHTSATIARIEGQPGAFEVDIRQDGSRIQVRVGSIVQATGWTPYDAARLAHLGYGVLPDVVTNVEFERMLSANAIRRGSDGKCPRRIAFVQCAGSRDPLHLPYCSTVCCRTTLKQAIWAREIEHDSEIYVLAKDIRTVGLHEGFYRRAQEDPLIFFTKGEVKRIETTDSGWLSIEVTDGLLGASVSIDADLVVLAVGMVPRASNNDALRELFDARTRLAKGAVDGHEADEATVRRLEAISGTGTLELSYRQGPDLPLDRYGFPDSHFICFPYETRRTGIYSAGALRGPTDLSGCRIDGEGAALKAIQAIEHAAAGAAMHPRWGDAGVPSFLLMRCTQCKRCTEECPFGTLDEDERCTPKLNPGRCRRCGICMGACPERIISFPEYSVDIVSSLIKSVPIPDEFEESPRILVLACENDAYPALEVACFHRLALSALVRVIPVRCLGAVNVVWIADAMAMGYDGVLLLGCKPGEDTQCHYLRGSDLMTTRSENVKQKLKQLALEDERVCIEYVTIADYRTIGSRIGAFVERIQEIGLNPFKDA
jgi:quinone-modifying oxidoreductase, subunit QmoB